MKLKKFLKYSLVAITTILAFTNIYHYSASAASSTDTSATMIIDGGTIKNTIRSQTGETAYNSYKINVKADDIESYTLQISAANNYTTSLQPENGNTAITGAGGRTGDNMLDNTWGYGWSDTDAKVNTLNYYTLPAYGANGTSINSGLLESTKASSVDFTKKLTFAARFGADAAPGHYTTTVLLSLAVSPKTVLTWNEMQSMQDMTSDTCKAASIGASKTLIDSRDNNSYTIAKLADENCWMTQNLRIAGTTVTANKSDMRDGASNFFIPNALSNFTGTNNNAAYYNNDAANGAYYSWYTATAGTGTSALTSGDATSSICPKGWRLPSGGKNGDYYVLVRKNWPEDKPTTGLESHGGKKGFWFGASSVSTGGAFFPAAGGIDGTNLGAVGNNGFYLTRTAYDADAENFLFFYNSSIQLENSKFSKYGGFSVRCVAYSN